MTACLLQVCFITHAVNHRLCPLVLNVAVFLQHTSEVCICRVRSPSRGGAHVVLRGNSAASPCCALSECLLRDLPV